MVESNEEGKSTTGNEEPADKSELRFPQDGGFLPSRGEDGPTAKMPSGGQRVTSNFLALSLA